MKLSLLDVALVGWVLEAYLSFEEDLSFLAAARALHLVLFEKYGLADEGLRV